MAVHINLVRPATEEEWLSAWSHCPQTTYFQSPQWAHIWDEYSKGKITGRADMIQFSDGVMAIIPYSRERTLFKKHNLWMSPGGTYGGWLANGLTEQHKTLLRQYIEHKAEQENTCYWRVSPFAYESKVRSDAGMDYTYMIDLGTGTEQQMRQWSKGHYATIAQAKKFNLIVEKAETEEDWQTYYQLYLQSVSRWGDKATGTYVYSLFDTLRTYQQKGVTLWLAKHEEQIIAGALCLYSSQHISYWHGAAHEAHFGKKPVHYLIYHILQDAAARGYKWFDFNPSAGLEGVVKFKKGFGAQPYACPVIYKKYVWSGVFNRIYNIIYR